MSGLTARCSWGCARTRKWTMPSRCKSKVGTGLKLEAPAYVTFVRVLHPSGDVVDAYEVFGYVVETEFYRGDCV
uniref:Uncharacterized protein n=1 Tax=Arundo donax TaxID=35708 RepID=A0A0A9HY12_ARUDO